MTVSVMIKFSGYQVRKLLAAYILEHYNIKVDVWQLKTLVCSGHQMNERPGSANFIFEGEVG